MIGDREPLALYCFGHDRIIITTKRNNKQTFRSMQGAND